MLNPIIAMTDSHESEKYVLYFIDEAIKLRRGEQSAPHHQLNNEGGEIHS